MSEGNKVLSQQNSISLPVRRRTKKRKNSDEIEKLGKKLCKNLDLTNNNTAKAKNNKSLKYTSNIPVTPKASMKTKNRVKRFKKSDESRTSIEWVESDEKTPNTPEIIDLDSDNECDDEVRSFECLKNVLGKHYFDVGQRLSLDYIPDCTTNVEKCAKMHSSKHGTKPQRLNLFLQMDAKQLVIEDRPLHFLKFVEDTILRNEFPDSPIILAVLELILTITKPSNSDYNLDVVIRESVRVLEETLNKFPPCWHGLKKEYFLIIFGRLQNECFTKYDLKEGIMKVVLLLMEECIEQAESSGTKKKTEQNSENLANYYMWEMNNEQKYDFELNSRTEKLERLFLVLHILVKILEMDLSMWILKHPKNTKVNMEKPTKLPLIASLLWAHPTDEEGVGDMSSGEINSFIKKIISMFVNAVSLNYPNSDVQILARLINLIGVSINLCEIQYDGEITYPCIKECTTYFAKQIKKAIEASPYYNFQLYFRVIKFIKTPMIKMILIEELLNKLNPCPGQPSIKKYLEHFRKQRWMECSTNVTNSMPSPQSNCKYKFFEKNKSRTKTSEISRKEYLRLLFVGFKSYLEVYRVHDYIQENIKAKSRTKNPKSPKKSHLDLVKQKFNFAALEDDLGDLVRKVNRKKVFVQNPTKPQLIFYEISVDVNLILHYRDEMKYFLILRDALDQHHKQDAELFSEWYTFLNHEILGATL